MKTGKLLLIIIGGLAVLTVIANQVRVHIANTAMRKGSIAREMDDYDLAISAYTFANKLIFWDKKKKADNLLWRGLSYYEKQDFDQALLDFTEGIELQQYLPPGFYFWRARTHYEMGNYNLAITDFSKSIEIAKHFWVSWDYYLKRAEAYFMNEDYALAVADYDRVISVLDEEINAHYLSDNKIIELKNESNDAFFKKKRTEKLIEWKLNNPGEDVPPSAIFSMEIIGTAKIQVYPDDPTTYEYGFYSIDLRNTVEIMSLGYLISDYQQTHPLSKKGSLVVTKIYENNTGLSQAIQGKMWQLGANVCMSSAFKNYLVVNLLLPDGTYTTVFFEPIERSAWNEKRSFGDADDI